MLQLVLGLRKFLSETFLKFKMPRPKKYDLEMRAFEENSGVKISKEVIVRPKAGEIYLYESPNEIPGKERWRADGHRWKQDGKKPFTWKGVENCYRIYFKLKIGPDEFTTAFCKKVYIFPTGFRSSKKAVTQ